MQSRISPLHRNVVSWEWRVSVQDTHCICHRDCGESLHASGQKKRGYVRSKDTLVVKWLVSTLSTCWLATYTTQYTFHNV
jgi:hypothetical protein